MAGTRSQSKNAAKNKEKDAGQTSRPQSVSSVAPPSGIPEFPVFTSPPTTDQILEILRKQTETIQKQQRELEKMKKDQKERAKEKEKGKEAENLETLEKSAENNMERRREPEPSGDRDKDLRNTLHGNSHQNENSHAISRTAHPFGNQIMSAPMPRDIKITTDKYNGKGDPQEHLEQFQTNMMAQDVSDLVGCRLFPTTLKEVALRWYSALPPNSIHNWDDLASKFLVRFATSKAQHKSTHALKTVRQGANESLRNFLNRFFDEALLVGDLEPPVALHLITDSLREGPFSESLAKHKPKTVEELRARSEKFISLEDYLIVFMHFLKITSKIPNSNR